MKKLYLFIIFSNLFFKRDINPFIFLCFPCYVIKTTIKKKKKKKKRFLQHYIGGTYVQSGDLRTAYLLFKRYTNERIGMYTVK
jgi:hypothetical protein